MNGTIQCSRCGEVVTKDIYGNYNHDCIADMAYIRSDNRTYEIEENKHSVIVEGKEYFVDSNKLAILEQLIKL